MIITNDKELKHVKLNTNHASILSAELSEGSGFSDVFLHEVKLEALIVELHHYVDGLQTCIWTDHDSDEPSTIKYLSFGNREIIDVTETSALVEAIYKAKKNEVILYQLVLEAYS